MSQSGNFEDLRAFATEAVEQLVREMASQHVAYRVPAENVLALLQGVATVKGLPTWDVWETWALRHALPVHDLVALSRSRPLDRGERDVLRKRLRDLFGYALLGLVLVECEDVLDKIDEPR